MLEVVMISFGLLGVWLLATGGDDPEQMA